MSTEMCVCGHGAEFHTGDGHTESACEGRGPFGFGGCSCAGYTTEPRCDFCSRLPAPWTYPTEMSVMDVVGIHGEAPVFEHEKLKTVISHAGWAACDGCAALIELDDRVALAERLPDADGLRAQLRSMQRLQFFNVRTGPGVRSA